MPVGTPFPPGCTLCAVFLVPPLVHVLTCNSKGRNLANVRFVALAKSRALVHHGLVAGVVVAVGGDQKGSLLRSLKVEQSLGLGLGLRNMQTCEMARSLAEGWNNQGVRHLRVLGMDSSVQRPWDLCTSWRPVLPASLRSPLPSTWTCQRLDRQALPADEMASRSVWSPPLLAKFLALGHPLDLDHLDHWH